MKANEISSWREEIAETLAEHGDASWKEWAPEGLVPHLYVVKRSTPASKGKKKAEVKKLSDAERRAKSAEVRKRYAQHMSALLAESEGGELAEEEVDQRAVSLANKKREELAEWGISDSEDEEEDEEDEIEEIPKPTATPKGKTPKGGEKGEKKSRKRKRDDLVDAEPGWRPARGVKVRSR